MITAAPDPEGTTMMLSRSEVVCQDLRRMRLKDQDQYHRDFIVYSIAYDEFSEFWAGCFTKSRTNRFAALHQAGRLQDVATCGQQSLEYVMSNFLSDLKNRLRKEPHNQPLGLDALPAALAVVLHEATEPLLLLLPEHDEDTAFTLPNAYPRHSTLAEGEGATFDDPFEDGGRWWGLMVLNFLFQKLEPMIDARS